MGIYCKLVSRIGGPIYNHCRPLRRVDDWIYGRPSRIVGRLPLSRGISEGFFGYRESGRTTVFIYADFPKGSREADPTIHGDGFVFYCLYRHPFPWHQLRDLTARRFWQLVNGRRIVNLGREQPHPSGRLYYIAHDDSTYLYWDSDDPVLVPHGLYVCLPKGSRTYWWAASQPQPITPDRAREMIAAGEAECVYENGELVQTAS